MSENNENPLKEEVDLTAGSEVPEHQAEKIEATDAVEQTEEVIEDVKQIVEVVEATEQIEEVIEEVIEEEADEASEEIEMEEIPDLESILPKAPEKSQVIPVEEFDWATVEDDKGGVTKEERSRMSDLYNQTLATIREKEVVDGTVVAMNKREVVINIGYKSEGVVNLNEFRYNPELQIGEVVEVYVESQEDRTGQLILSHKKARALKSWDRVNQAMANDEIIKGFVKCRTKGGMIVDVFGIEAFLPGSQIDVRPIRDYDIFVNKTMEFKVVKINQEFHNVVVSHKALIEAELELQKAEIISRLEKGQVLEGTVKNITSYGVFVDLGGVDGLIHITDLSWGRINHPEEVVTLDQKINVVILDFDDQKKRIALGLKQLSSHPWDSLSENLNVGDVAKGKVVVLADYGAFIEIAPGVEGLIHVSEMSWSQHLRSAQEFLKVGEEIEAKILTLDRDDRKMSLGIKQLREDPWQKVEDKYIKGSKHSAKVRSFTGFGIFVEIEEGVDGLIHISDLSWTRKFKHPAEFCQIGDSIEVVVLDIDKENRRLSLGHKQLEENPWDVFETIFSVDSVHEGTVTEIFDKGAVINLPYGVEGFATLRHLQKEDGSNAKVEEKIEFKVIEFSKSAKRIIVSHLRIWEDKLKNEETTKKKAADKEAKKGTKTVSDNLEKTTLGDYAELAALKTELEESARKTLVEREKRIKGLSEAEAGETETVNE